MCVCVCVSRLAGGVGFSCLTRCSSTRSGLLREGQRQGTESCQCVGADVSASASASYSDGVTVSPMLVPKSLC